MDNTVGVSIRLPTGQTVVIEGPVVLIGSGADCDLRLPAEETAVRPQHAKIRKIADRWIIESQGDWLIRVEKDEPGRTAWLVAGDSIRLAPAGPTIVFQPKDASSPTATSGTAKKANESTAALAIEGKKAEQLVRRSDMLPRLYLALGNHVFEKRLFEHQLGSHFREVHKVNERLLALKSNSTGESVNTASQLTEERRKAIDRANSLSLNASSALATLGHAAYEQFGKQAGPIDLIEPIETCIDRLKELDEEIGESASPRTSKLTPWNFLLMFLVVIFISSLYVISRAVLR